MVDYLQKLTPADPRRQRHEQVAAMSSDLKTLARELSVPVLCLAQVNRSSDKANDRRPTLSSLRESGSIEADADGVWLLHRPGDYEPDNAELRGVAILDVAKNRNGRTGDFKLQWDAAATRFRTAVPEVPVTNFEDAQLPPELF